MGKSIALTCTLESSTGDVGWKFVESTNEEITITTCSSAGSCTAISRTAALSADYSAGRNENMTSLTIGVKADTISLHRCISGDVVLHSFTLIIITLAEIQSPICRISPSIKRESEIIEIEYTCESEALSGLKQVLTINNIGREVTLKSSTLVKSVILNDVFRKTSNASCQLLFTDLEIVRECTFPSPAVIHQTTNGGDRVFECEFDEVPASNKYKWRLLDSDNEEVDISSRAWIRGGSRYLLLLEITEDDVGKVVECRVYRSNDAGAVIALGFTVISEHRYPENATKWSDVSDSWTSKSTATPMTNVSVISEHRYPENATKWSDVSDSWASKSTATPMTNVSVISEHRYPENATKWSDVSDSWASKSTATPMTNVEGNLFMTLSIVFSVLWILTITLSVVWYKCTKRKTKEDNSAPTYSTVIYTDSRAPAPFPAENSAADTKDATYYYHTIKGGAVDLDEDGYLVLTGDMGGAGHGGVVGDKGREAESSRMSHRRDVDEDEDGYLVILQDSRDDDGGNGGREAGGEVKCNEYMEMSGSQGQVEYEWMKSLTYENCAK